MMEQLALFSQCKELRIGKCADEDYFSGGLRHLGGRASSPILMNRRHALCLSDTRMTYELPSVSGSFC